MTTRIVLFGATGMIGGGVLRACLKDERFSGFPTPILEARDSNTVGTRRSAPSSSRSDERSEPRTGTQSRQ